MKTALLMTILVALTMACDGGGGGVDIGQVEEGTGPALNVSKSAENVTLVQSVLRGLAAIQNAALAKAVGGDDTLGAADLCAKGKVSIPVDVALASASTDTSKVTGSLDASRDGDSGTSSITLVGELAGYSYKDGTTGKQYTFAGSTTFGIHSNVSAGIDAYCKAPASTPVTSAVDTQMTAALSISGAVGAAIAIEMSASGTVGPDADDAAAGLASGVADIKSGGKTVHCTIAEVKNSATPAVTCQ